MPIAIRIGASLFNSQVEGFKEKGSRSSALEMSLFHQSLEEFDLLSKGGGNLLEGSLLPQGLCQLLRVVALLVVLVLAHGTETVARHQTDRFGWILGFDPSDKLQSVERRPRPARQLYTDAAHTVAQVSAQPDLPRLLQ